MATPTPDRILYVAEALRRGWAVERVFDLTKIDHWFLNRIKDIVSAEKVISELGIAGLDADHMMAAKQLGFSDAQLAHLTGQREDTVRAVREGPGRAPVHQGPSTPAPASSRPARATTTSPTRRAA